MNGSWYFELTRLALVAAACFVVGSLVGHPLLVITAGLLLLLLWQLRQSIKVRHWLRDPSTAAEMHGSGIWDDIYGLLVHNRRKHQNEINALRETLERYRQAIRALPEGAITLGGNDEIELFNATASRILGLKEPEDSDRPITHLVREPEFVRYMEAEEFDDALEIVHEDTPLLIRVVPYGGSGKKLLLIQDMTRIHKLEKMRRDFVANVSHEMKSPLTVIKGYVESMLDKVQGKPVEFEKALNQVDAQTDRMCHIVEDLLQLSNLEAGAITDRPETVDVPALIRSVAREAEELSAGAHTLEVDIDDELLIGGVFNELYSAFSNIVFNAVTYTPAGGKIAISWRLDQSGAPVFSVADTGVGIAPEHIPRLTERFYRVDQARSRELGGTGLGLAIVKHVLIRHDAMLKISSRLNEGSTFTCVFPPAAARPRDRRASNA